MNVENLRTLAHELRADPDTFDQRSWCGTACCIAGHAAAMSGYEPRHDFDWEGVEAAARGWLDLPGRDAYVLYATAQSWPQPFKERFLTAVYGPLDGDGEPVGDVPYGHGSVELPAFVAADLLDALAAGKVTL